MKYNKNNINLWFKRYKRLQLIAIQNENPFQFVLKGMRENNIKNYEIPNATDARG